MKLWAELYLHIELLLKEKEGSGKFRDQLDKRERKTFDEMMSISRLYNVAGVGSCKPVLFHPILISIIFDHYKQMRKFENENKMIKKIWTRQEIKSGTSIWLNKKRI